MQLTNVQCLTAAYTDHDANELAAVMQSTFSVTPSSALRWSKVDPVEAERWLRQACSRGFAAEFNLPRISNMDVRTEIPTKLYAEHLVVRDLDMEHLEGTGSSPIAGRVVAHADYKYLPSMGDVSDQPVMAVLNNSDLAAEVPGGFNNKLNVHLNGMIESTIYKVFYKLACFNLEGLSTLTPSHTRKGIAKRLVEWVYPFADRYALPVVLAASPVGLGLYRTCGFESYREYDIIIDLTEWGGEGEHRHVIMVRWPINLDRLPQSWKEWRKAHSTCT